MCCTVFPAECQNLWSLHVFHDSVQLVLMCLSSVLGLFMKSSAAADQRLDTSGLFSVIDRSRDTGVSGAEETHVYSLWSVDRTHSGHEAERTLTPPPVKR